MSRRRRHRLALAGSLFVGMALAATAGLDGGAPLILVAIPATAAVGFAILAIEAATDEEDE